MLRMNARTWPGILIGLALVLLLSLNASTSALEKGNEIAPASLDGFVVTDALPGAVYVDGGLTSSSEHQIVGSRIPTTGRLAYPDLQRVELRAHEFLEKNKQFRLDISPHAEKPGFDTLVKNFDYASGFFTPTHQGGPTLQNMLDTADSELRQARDMYAYLAVYADEARFRADPVVSCPDEPTIDDPFETNLSNIDWCNFPARMRESLREAAYLRMIFGQQFTADALGFTFSGDTFGGDDLVSREVYRLEQAEEQFQLARQAITEGFDHYLGNGCYVQSFYTDAEWILLSRAVEGLERARHHIAVRRSYLSPDTGGLPAAQAQAQGVFRAAATDQYVDLILTANLATSQTGCERGTRPEQDVVAKMVAGLAATEQSAREMEEGRNIFGFDVSFTPARPYYLPPSSPDRGLWNQAQDEANRAETLEAAAQADQRDFDRKKSDLDGAILNVRGDYYLRLGDLTGCSPGPNFDTCVDTAADKLRGCDPWLIEGNAAFSACVSGTGASGQLREEWEDLRSALLEVKRAEKELENIGERINVEVDRRVTVRHEIMTNGRDQAIMEFAATLLDSLSVSCGIGEGGCSVSYNPAAHWIALLRSGQVVRQAVADANIEGANSEAVVRNLLLDIVELQIDLEIAAHKANAHLTVFENVASGVKDLAVETRRAEAYVANSPANDPSYRLQRDSNRLTLADQLELAARASYLAAKRAEYEYAARLVEDTDFRISDIYRARTADDIESFLTDLQDRTDNLIVQGQDIDRVAFTLSVAQDVLGWTDEQLGLTGEAADVERLRRFREWVAAHTVIEGGEPVLVFRFATSAADSGIFANVIGQVYKNFWLHKVAGVGEPKPASNGFGVNIVTSQTGNLEFRGAEVTQSGVVHLKARSGCIFEYRLIHPAALLGMGWPDSQDPEEATAAVLASINGQNGNRTTVFLGRAVSATDWQVKIYTRASGQDDLDLGQLEDIELLIDTTYASRSPGPPSPDACIRIDY